MTDETKIDHDTFIPLDELEADQTFVELVERLNDIVRTVNAIVEALNGTHELHDLENDAQRTKP